MKTTKSILSGLIVVLIALLFIQACEKPENGNLTGQHSLKSGEVKIVDNMQQKVTMTLLSISDSRCPANVQCFWEGYATVEIQLEYENQTKNLILCTGGCEAVKKQRQQALTVDDINYTLRLLELTDQTAKIEIKKS